MGVSIVELSREERDKLLRLEEGHFCELKATAIQPSKLTRTVAAFSNAEGGELYVGLGQDSSRRNFWSGFATQEGANGHLQCIESLFPLGDGYSYSFLRSPTDSGLVLKVEAHKSREVKKAWDGSTRLPRYTK